MLHSQAKLSQLSDSIYKGCANRRLITLLQQVQQPPLNSHYTGQPALASTSS